MRTKRNAARFRTLVFAGQQVRSVVGSADTVIECEARSMSSRRVVFVGSALPAGLASWAAAAELTVHPVTSTAAASDSVVGVPAELVVVAMGLDRLGELAGLARLRELPGGRGADLVLVCPPAAVERLRAFASPLRVHAVLPEPLDVTALPRRVPASPPVDAAPEVRVEARVTRRQSAPISEDVIRSPRTGRSGGYGSADEHRTSTSENNAPTPGGLSLADLRARVAALGRQDHFQRIGVPRDVSVAGLAGVFGVLVKQLSPANYTRDRSGAGEVAETLLRALTAAYDTLADPAARAAYVARLDHMAGTRVVPTPAAEGPMRPVHSAEAGAEPAPTPKSEPVAVPEAWVEQEAVPEAVPEAEVEPEAVPEAGLEPDAIPEPAALEAVPDGVAEPIPLEVGRSPEPAAPPDEPAPEWDWPDEAAVAPLVAALEAEIGAADRATEDTPSDFAVETAREPTPPPVVDPPRLGTDATFEDVDDIFGVPQVRRDDVDAVAPAAPSAPTPSAAAPSPAAPSPAAPSPPAVSPSEPAARIRRTPDQALASGPKDWLLEARFFLLFGDFERAVALVDACVHAEASSRRYQYWQATIHGQGELRRGNLAAARAQLDRAVRLAGPGQHEAATALSALEQAEAAV